MPMTATSPSWRTHSWSFVKRTALMLKLLRAVITCRDKGQSRDMRRPRHVAHDQRQRAAIGIVGGIDIAHRDWRADRRSKTAARHRADRVAGGIDDRGALARRRAPVRTDADPLACGPLGQ